MQGSVYKSVFRNAAYIFFIKLFPALASVVVLILYSRALPQRDYGAYQELLIRMMLLGTLAYAGLPVTIITYSADLLKGLMLRLKARHYGLFAAWLLAWSGVFAWLSAGQELSWVLALLLPAAYAGHAVQEGLLMAGRKMDGLLAVNFLYGCYFLVVHLLLLDDYSLARLMWYVLAGMVVRMVMLTLIIYAVYRRVPSAELEPAKLASVRRLWLHLGFYDLMQNLLRYLDKFILSLFLSAALYAIYFNGAQTAEIPFLPYLLGAVSGSILIQLSGRDLSGADSYKLLKSSGKLLAAIVFPLFFFLCFFRTELFSLVLTEKYASSVPIFLTAIMVLPLRAYNYTTMLQHLHQGALINKGALLDFIIVIALMYPLYLWLGLPGVALSLVISTYCQVTYYVWHITRLLGAGVAELLPLGNWLVQLVIYGLAFYLLHLAFSASLGGRAVLIAGFVSLGVITLAALAIQWRMLRKKEVTVQ